MDLDQSLDEQADEFDQIKENKRTTILLRTQLSVRVHTCVGKNCLIFLFAHYILAYSTIGNFFLEKILNSKDTELRRSLFLLKQLFQVNEIKLFIIKFE